MAERRGNKTDYLRESIFEVNANGDGLKFGKLGKSFGEYSDEELEEAWRRSCKRDPFIGLYDKLKHTACAPLDCERFREALEFLFKATGDEAFQAAAHAMENHGIMHGSLKATVLSKAGENRRAVWASMARMHVWVTREKNLPTRAARLTAAERGIPGTTFDTVTHALCNSYQDWLKKIAP